jgi:hypothetical protein
MANDTRLVTYVTGTPQTPRDPMLTRSRFARGLGTGRGVSLEA